MTSKHLPCIQLQPSNPGRSFQFEFLRSVEFAAVLLLQLHYYSPTILHHTMLVTDGDFEVQYTFVAELKVRAAGIIAGEITGGCEGTATMP